MNMPVNVPVDNPDADTEWFVLYCPLNVQSGKLTNLFGTGTTSSANTA